ncbi:nitroreductase/quinone reductase family protein [Antrihabitans sp. YC2-6]|uniref:nitroreductase/quinone reductase family protein n=1 Tax=Antrihabitans sp. YC2-6 TaxID=2799498 RepID=UPI0018F3A786|nr:nitroreductase/quinone reductase family protein [Antrihabitans sp. YC2-6]MBJ8345599.1 nitroreductase family deazaflavin-dependent oxidoreductase [Antrihabitans sp. YC2-6]
MPLPRRLARINRRATNRISGLIAGRMPGFAIVVHKGRNSGREYRTPVNAFQNDAGYRIALTYGSDADWIKNVLADNGCELDHRGSRVALTAPQVIHDPDVSWAPLGVRQILLALDAPYYVQLQLAQ